MLLNSMQEFLQRSIAPLYHTTAYTHILAQLQEHLEHRTSYKFVVGRVDKKFDQFKQDLVGKDKRSFDYTKRCWFQLIVSKSGEAPFVAIINPAETADDQYINSKDASSPLIDLLLVQIVLIQLMHSNQSNQT